MPQVLPVRVGLHQFRLVHHLLEDLVDQRKLVALDAVHDAVAQGQVRYQEHLNQRLQIPLQNESEQRDVFQLVQVLLRNVVVGVHLSLPESIPAEATAKPAETGIVLARKSRIEAAVVLLVDFENVVSRHEVVEVESVVFKSLWIHFVVFQFLDLQKFGFKVVDAGLYSVLV